MPVMVNGREISDEAACDVAMERLLDREAPVREPTKGECRRFYERNLERYTTGEIVEAALLRCCWRYTNRDLSAPPKKRVAQAPAPMRAA